METKECERHPKAGIIWIGNAEMCYGCWVEHFDYCPICGKAWEEHSDTECRKLVISLEKGE